MRNEFTALLLSQVGQHEGRDPDGTWNNHQRYSTETPGLEWSDGQPWCATFQCWGAHRTPGMEALWPMTASCSTAVDWWQQHGRWSDYPVLGGPFYLGPGGGTHTGVVVAFDADTITTVEGNSNEGGSANGDGVYKRTRLRRGPGSPYGYGVPAYPEGTISADPKLGGTRTAAVAAPDEEDELATTLSQERSDLWNAMIWGLKHTCEATQQQVTALQGTVTALAGLLAAQHSDLTAEQVEDAVRKAIADSLVHVQVDVAQTAPKES